MIDLLIACVLGEILFNLTEKYLPGLKEDAEESTTLKKGMTDSYYKYALEHPEDPTAKKLLEVLNKRYAPKT